MTGAIAVSRRSWSRPARIAVRMTVMLLFVALIGAGLIVFQQFKSGILKVVIKSITSQVPTVATAQATMQDWQPRLAATGTLRAVNGADVAAEVGGIIDEIHIDSGADDAAGALLLEADQALWDRYALSGLSLDDGFAEMVRANDRRYNIALNPPLVPKAPASAVPLGVDTGAIKLKDGESLNPYERASRGQ